MSHKRYGGAYTVIFEPGNSNAIYVGSHNDTGSGTDTGSVNQADTGKAHNWINKVKAAKGAAHKWYLGDTGWSDTGYGQVDNKGTVLDVWHRYDTGAGVGGDWDKTSWRVTK